MKPLCFGISGHPNSNVEYSDPMGRRVVAVRDYWWLAVGWEWGDGSAALESSSSPRPPSVVHGRNVQTPSTGPPNPVPSKVGFNGKALKCARQRTEAN
jgi:hypothetical protein